MRYLIEVEVDEEILRDMRESEDEPLIELIEAEAGWMVGSGMAVVEVRECIQ